jgi:hypothetical protein
MDKIMKKSNHNNSEIDPKLIEMLELLEPTLPRDPEDAARGMERFLMEADESLPTQSGTSLPWFKKWGKKNQKEENDMTTRRQIFAMKTLAMVAILAALVFGGVGMTALAAGNALPGDALYPFKTGMEQTRLNLTSGAAQQARLHLEYAERRLDELAALIAAGRFDATSQAAAEFEFHIERAIESLSKAVQDDPVEGQELASQIAGALSRYAQTLTSLHASSPEPARPAIKRALQAADETAMDDRVGSTEIEFIGVVEAKTAEAWTISGRTVVIIAGRTQIKNEIQVGDTVKVHALVGAEGRLTAREVELARGATSGEEIEFRGAVESMTAEVWSIGGKRVVVIAGRTEIKGDIKVGDTVKVHALVGVDGKLTAREIELISQATVTEEIEFRGTVDAITAEAWTIGGRTVAVVAGRTQVKGEIKIGDTVKVHALVGAEGRLTAREIELISPTAVTGEIEFRGMVEAITTEAWTISGRTVSVVAGRTEIKGAIKVGDTVKVHALVGPDGRLTAREIELITPSLQREVEVRVTGIVLAVSETSLTIEGDTFRITPQTEIRGTITNGAWVEVRGVRDANGALTATRIQLVEIESEDNQSEVRFSGVVEAMGGEAWTIAGRKVIVVPLVTEIRDLIRTGDVVKVRATLGADGVLVAERIELDN